MIKQLILAVLILTAAACNNKQSENKMETTKTENTPLFPKGERTPAEYFRGNAYLHPIQQRTANNDFVIGSVTFEPGARTNWHTHPKGQVLIVTEGEGLYQEKGKAARIIRKGDVVDIPVDVEHWHGATAKTKMVHIAITNYLGEENANWLAPVSDEEYKQANQ
ncbi:cupin domain-containing protein [Flavobacterium sp. Sd200]|uniref:(R)-mandelonitrile lyase n=1 Tax=Flavobacterium sp. Sd200 TaxID=2692211 RepID=UPI001369E535|nr:cupin domain-containing protein [Flavobacterium sp. Sd200]MXN90956.1 cupin domain-containing protein [Flavobacterium sp. Sd200]